MEARDQSVPLPLPLEHSNSCNATFLLREKSPDFFSHS
jgi:hypothetical protein